MPAWALALRLMGAGWFVAAAIVLGVVGGYWLGRWTGAVVVCILLGTVLGTIVAFYGLYQMVKPLMNDDQRKR